MLEFAKVPVRPPLHTLFCIYSFLQVCLVVLFSFHTFVTFAFLFCFIEKPMGQKPDKRHSEHAAFG